MKYLFIVIIASFFVSSCNQPTKDAPSTVQVTKDVKRTILKYEVSDWPSSPSYENAMISSLSYAKGVFNFNVENFDLGAQTSDAETKMCANSGKGQHIHLIVDDLPYAAKYESNFEHDISDGEHYILAFLSRSYHESIKKLETHLVAKVTTKDKSITSAEGVTRPMIFYSRPKGTYVGKDTENIMLDFFLINPKIGSHHYVEADINGEVHRLEKWAPYSLKGLPMGENTITLTLKHKNGTIVDAPLNPVSRTFMLKPDPTPKK